MRRHKITIFSLSVFLFLLLLLVSITGIVTDDFYRKETPNWQVQSIGQDWVDLLFVCPVLLLSSYFMYKDKAYAHALWAGCTFYLTYTFTIYCFDVKFNQLFLLYCIILGLSFYLSLYYLYDQLNEPIHFELAKKIRRVIAIYFLFIALSFYLLWLSDIIPAISSDKLPASIAAAGLPTNAVHVIDLAIFLPAVFICGITLLNNNLVGSILAGPILWFFVLMDITISVLTFMMYGKGFAETQSVGFVMLLLAVLSAALLVLYQRSIGLHSKYETLSENIHPVSAVV